MGRSNRNRRDYDRVKNEDDEEQQQSQNQQENVDNGDDDDDDPNLLTVVVMDPAQNKFPVSVHPDWTVAQFKTEGVAVHKIPVPQQRLIYMGRMLADDTILKDAGIVAAKTIVHLFPKPRVVVCSGEDSNNTSASANSQQQHQQQQNGSSDGAHVPRIVLDEREAEMRTSILVLGSSEIMEAQNNVKLLSFLLLIIASMELLALLTKMLGVPTSEGPSERNVDDAISETDDYMDIANNATWRNSDYFDLLLNMFCLYSALLGIRATTENTRRVALRYLICTIACGVAWTGFYYYLNYAFEEQVDEKRIESADDDEITPLTSSELAWQALFAVFIPTMIWLLCFYRAFQFHALLREAENEAEERIRNELNLDEDGDDNAHQQEQQPIQVV